NADGEGGTPRRKKRRRTEEGVEGEGEGDEDEEGEDEDGEDEEEDSSSSSDSDEDEDGNERDPDTLLRKQDLDANLINILCELCLSIHHYADVIETLDELLPYLAANQVAKTNAAANAE